MRRITLALSAVLLLAACSITSPPPVEHGKGWKPKPPKTTTTTAWVTPTNPTTTIAASTTTTIQVTTSTAPAATTTIPATSTTVAPGTTTTVPAPTTTVGPTSPGFLIGPAGPVHPSSDGTGNFRTSCRLSHIVADDPIVRPGQPGTSHMHSFFGNRTVNAFSNTMMTGTSNCAGGDANRSGYWIPTVYDSTGNPAPLHNMGVYYKSGYQGVSPSQIQVFPAGLRMVSDRHRWSCNPATNYTQYSSIPACGGGGILGASVEFPQCWDGINLDSPDHRSHMAFGQWGSGCPASHPVGMPGITINVFFDIPAGTSTSTWTMSSDMGATPGSTLHGDWWNGWDPVVMQTFVDNCTSKPVDCGVNNLGQGQQLLMPTA